MCGIFIASLSKKHSFSVEDVLKSIKHRGPDDQGVFVSDNNSCHLGHVRLSIIDLSKAGHQPMEDSSGRFIIVYNGEIYNYQDLKKILEVAHGTINWKSTTDTEVILEGFAREGIPFLSRLNGIFSLAIFDRHKQELHVLRDPLGVKPLFYTQQNGSVLFCSELKGLLSIKTLKRTLRQQSLADQLAFMYVPEPYTLYKEFKKVAPGICVTYRNGEETASENIFSHLNEPITFSSENEIIEHFYSTFSKVVQQQLVSDTPVSLMLSGGLDSSAIAHEIVHGGHNIQDAYTISFSGQDRKYDQQSDDLYYAKMIANKLGIKLNIIPAELDFISLLPSISKFLEDGISDPAAINSYLICEAARSNGIKVIMSGQGADEFLGGYRRYSAERLVGNLPKIMRYPSKRIGDLLPNNLPGRFNAFNRRLKRLLTLAGQDRKERLLGMYIWGTNNRIVNLFKEPVDIVIGEDLINLFDEIGNNDIIHTMMQVDHKYDLMSLNLTYTDRMSMACGVEARVPFLDLELVRLMNSIPTKIKMKNGVPKYILKKAMKPHLPHEIVYREKAGFGLPLRSWMRQENELTKYYFDTNRIEKQGIFNPDAVQAMYKENLNGKADLSSLLFSMLSIQISLESQDSLTKY